MQYFLFKWLIVLYSSFLYAELHSSILKVEGWTYNLTGVNQVLRYNYWLGDVCVRHILYITARIRWGEVRLFLLTVQSWKWWVCLCEREKQQLWNYWYSLLHFAYPTRSRIWLLRIQKKIKILLFLISLYSQVAYV